MRSEDIKKGMRVEIVTLDEDYGFQADEKCINVRKIGVTGVVMESHFPDGGSFWWVKHDGSKKVGVYVYYEMKKI